MISLPLAQGSSRDLSAAERKREMRGKAKYVTSQAQAQDVDACCCVGARKAQLEPTNEVESFLALINPIKLQVQKRVEKPKPLFFVDLGQRSRDPTKKPFHIFQTLLRKLSPRVILSHNLLDSIDFFPFLNISFAVPADSARIVQEDKEEHVYAALVRCLVNTMMKRQ